MIYGNGYFSDMLRSPRIYILNVLTVRLVCKSLCGLAYRKNSLFPGLKFNDRIILDMVDFLGLSINLSFLNWKFI